MYNPSDFLYSSGYLRSVAGHSSELRIVDKVLGAKDYESAKRMVLEYSKSGEQRDNDPDRAMERLISKAFTMCYELSPSRELVDIFALKYICQNVKTAIKKSLLPAEVAAFYDGNEYFLFTSVKPEEIERAITEKDYSALPENIAKAIPEALELYSKSGDPQLIDLILDRASLIDMKKYASGFGNELISSLATAKIDIFNVLSFIRCTQMKKDFTFLKYLLTDGGSISVNDLSAAYSDNLDALYELLKKTPLADTAASISPFSADSQTQVFERAFDLYYQKLLDKVMYLPFGPEIIADYIAAKEKEATNIQIALTCKNVGLNATETKRLMRI